MYNSLNRTAELKSLLGLLDTSHPGHFGLDTSDPGRTCLETLRSWVRSVQGHF